MKIDLICPLLGTEGLRRPPHKSRDVDGKVRSILKVELHGGLLFLHISARCVSDTVSTIEAEALRCDS